MKVENSANLVGFADASALLAGGVFVLRLRGEVMFVGRAGGPMLPKIAALRSAERPSWMGRIPFDEVLIRAVHPDRTKALRDALIAEFQPKYNLAPSAPVEVCVIERRI